MPNVERGKDLQHAHATNALNYGHLGIASYDRGAREWVFLRRRVTRRASESAFPFLTVKRETVYEDSTKYNELASGIRNPSGSSAGNHRPYPFPALPCLAPASIKEEESLSRAVITSLDQYDSLLSDQLAFGSASWLSESDMHSSNATVPIAALASGANGEFITLTQIGRDRVTVIDDKDEDLALKIPTITSNNRTLWTGSGGPVLQICFAALSGYQSTWMAARLVSSTIIFHPLFHTKPTPVMTQSSISSPEVQYSHLEANPILSIPISRTGGHPHADISFHPIDCHMLALVDQHGNWSTWQIDGKRSVTTRALFRIQLLRTGKLYSWENLRRPPQADPYHDSWHKICWVTDDSGYFDSIFIANRRDAVIHAHLDEEQYTVSLGLGQAIDAEWILDVKKSALHLGWIFILTSTRVLCISTINNEWSDMPKADSHTVLCHWQHFRSRRDITLSLAILETAQCTVILLLSRISAIVNAYRVDVPLGHSPIPLSWVEPSLLDISEICARSNVHDALESPLTLLFRPVQILRPANASDEPLTLPLCKLFILQADRSVSEVLLRGTEKLFHNEDHDNPTTIHLPLESYIRSMSSKYAELDELDDFIVQGSEDVPHTYADPQEERNQQGHRELDRPEVTADLTIDCTEIYETVVEGSKMDPSGKPAEFDDYLGGILPKLERSGTAEPGLRLLSELASPLLLVVDVEASSATIISLVKRSSSNGQASSVLCCLPEKLRSTNALDVYQILVSHWLSPVPPEVPDRIRVNKERLARSIAADLALAGIATRPPIGEIETHAVQESFRHDFDPPASAKSASSLDLTRADATAHPQSVSSLPSAAEEHPACVRLRAYTTVSRDAVTSATPASVLDILIHLPSDAEADPSAYDWRGTEGTISAEYDESAKTADPRMRRRAEKLAQAKRRRTQLEAKAAELVRQQAPPAIGSSQMVLPTREPQSSQVMVPERNVFGDDQPMTQPERGVFGTRLGGMAAGRKDKGKKRTAGF